jgi:hypothetical protein
MLRLIAGYGAVASALPYLALKIVWLSGGTVGAANPGIMRESSMIVLNAVTAAMDLVGIGLALAFTHRWGLRIPAWLLLPPMWVASGLLTRFVVGVPLAAVLTALMSGGFPRVTSGPVQPWVYVVVYVEFAGLGIGLMLAFLLYAKARWVEGLPSSVTRPGATRDVEVGLANSMAPVTLALGVQSFVWAFYARTILGSLINVIDAALMMGAAAGDADDGARPRQPYTLLGSCGDGLDRRRIAVRVGPVADDQRARPDDASSQRRVHAFRKPDRPASTDRRARDRAADGVFLASVTEEREKRRTGESLSA